MPAQTSVSCPAARRFRSLMTFCRSDVLHAARALSRHPDSPGLQASLAEARRDLKHQSDEDAIHRASCDMCFESGDSL